MVPATQIPCYMALALVGCPMQDPSSPWPPAFLEGVLFMSESSCLNLSVGESGCAWRPLRAISALSLEPWRQPGVVELARVQSCQKSRVQVLAMLLRAGRPWANSFPLEPHSLHLRLEESHFLGLCRVVIAFRLKHSANPLVIVIICVNSPHFTNSAPSCP